MAKADLELVKVVMQRNALPLPTVAKVIEDINTELQAAADDEEKTPAVKKQFVIMVSDPEGVLNGKHLVGWVLQLPEEDSPYLAEERLFRSAYEHNLTRKGRRMPVKTIAEVCEHVPSRVTKEQNVWVKTKEPVLLVPVNGKVPMERQPFHDKF